MTSALSCTMALMTSLAMGGRQSVQETVESHCHYWDREMVLRQVTCSMSMHSTVVIHQVIYILRVHVCIQYTNHVGAFAQIKFLDKSMFVQL